MPPSLIETRSMHRFLRSCSHAQLSNLIRAFEAVLPQIARVESIVQQGTIVDMAAVPKTDIITRRKSSKKRDDVVAKRPLNSFIAFRAYYSKLFSSVQQKEISGYLTKMWNADPFQAKWSIVAKAYSIIRDAAGKGKAPLDAFLSLACERIGIIPPKEYLEIFGWQMPTAKDPELRRAFIPCNDSFDDHIRSSTMSEMDLVNICIAAGYVEQGDLANIPTSNSSLAMASPPSANPVRSVSRRQKKLKVRVATRQQSAQSFDRTDVNSSVTGVFTASNLASEVLSPLPATPATSSTISSVDENTITTSVDVSTQTFDDPQWFDQFIDIEGGSSEEQALESDDSALWASANDFNYQFDILNDAADNLRFKDFDHADPFDHFDLGAIAAYNPDGTLNRHFEKDFDIEQTLL